MGCLAQIVKVDIGGELVAKLFTTKHLFICELAANSLVHQLRSLDLSLGASLLLDSVAHHLFSDDRHFHCHLLTALTLHWLTSSC